LQAAQLGLLGCKRAKVLQQHNLTNTPEHHSITPRALMLSLRTSLTHHVRKHRQLPARARFDLTQLNIKHLQST
jgi:hypothetical protein